MATTKITLEALSALMADPATTSEDLAPYFRANSETSDAFAPSIEINPDTVVIPDASDRDERSALLLNGANWLERMNRQAKFRRKLSDGNYSGPIIVEEGDSWFQFPVLLKDTIDVLMEEFAVFSLSAGGDTLDNMVRKGEYRTALEETGASVLLLSGGGNDLVADGQLAKHLRSFDPSLEPTDYLLPSFDQLISRAMGHYDTIFRDVTSRFPKVHIFCHGYDYTLPEDGKWLGKPMAKRKIKDNDLQRAIAAVMVDRLNQQLGQLAARFPKVRYLDMRGKVGTMWHDELHPTNQGYKIVAKSFSDAIRSVGGRSRGAASTPSSVSLHLGLNTVDRTHYGTGLQDLDFCVADADEMERLMQEKGYGTITKLTNGEATRSAMIEAVEDAAKHLKSGDIFCMTYAGHGGQVKDFNADEQGGPDHDNLDETLCLFDGQLIDDELYNLWSKFADGVRVVTVFDCCHSGSSIRNTGTRLSLAAAQSDGLGKARAVALSDCARIFAKNREFYRSLPTTMASTGILTRELNYPIAATVIQLSACQSNQVARESFGNGLFTETLISAIGQASASGGYPALMERIAQQMPASQSPKYWSIGIKNVMFEGQVPFSV